MAKSKTPKDLLKPDTPHAPVIDLVAEPVSEPEPAPEPSSEPVEEPKAPPPPPPPPPRAQPRRSRSALYWTAALALLAALAGAWLYRSYGESLWPSDRTLAMEAKLASLEAGQGTLNAQLKEIGATVDSTLARESALTALAQRSGADAASAAERAAAAGTAIDAASARLAALETELGRLKNSIAAMQSAPPSISGAAPPIDLGALKVLEGRVDSLEKALAALSAVKRGPDADTVATLSQALSDLKAKLALGAPFDAELGVISGLVPAAPGLDVLALSASKGIDSPERLAAKLRGLAEALPNAGAAPPAAESEGGFWDSVGSLFGSVVTVKTIGETDWRDLAIKAADAAATGDLRLAIERLTAPGGDMPAALSGWIAEAKARSDATAALSAADQAVLRHIASIGQPK